MTLKRFWRHLSPKGQATFVMTAVVVAGVVLTSAIFAAIKVRTAHANPASSPTKELLTTFPPVGVMVTNPSKPSHAPLTQEGVLSCRAAYVFETANGTFVSTSDWQNCSMSHVADDPNAAYFTFPERMLSSTPEAVLTLSVDWYASAVNGQCLFVRLVSDENCVRNENGEHIAALPRDLSSGLDVLCPNGESTIPFMSVKSTRSVDGKDTYAFAWNSLRVPVSQTSFHTPLEVFTRFTNMELDANVLTVSYTAWDGFTSVAGVVSFCVSAFAFLWYHPNPNDPVWRFEELCGGMAACECCNCRSETQTTAGNDDV